MEIENIINNEASANNSSEEKKCDTKKCRSCLNLILNIIALTGVIVLFILYFSGNKCQNKNMASKANGAGLSIGYINSDSLMKNYDFVKALKDSFEIKQKAAEANFSIQQKTFENEVLAYQSKVKANTLSIEQATATEKLLMQKQENLLKLKDELTQTLAEEEAKMSIMIQDTIISYIKRFNTEFNYDYILGFSQGGGILYANDSLDITKTILKGINKEYNK